MPAECPCAVPYGADQPLYIVTDRVSGTKDIRIERADLETTIHDLIAGCFSDPVRVTCFNTLEHWTQDLSAEIAAEIQARCDIDGVALPEHLRDFVESHIFAARRLRGLRPPAEARSRRTAR